MNSSPNKESTEDLGNPLPIINKYFGLVSKVNYEFEYANRNCISLSASKDNISQNILDKLNRNIYFEEDSNGEFISVAEKAINLINQIEMPPHIASNYPTDEYMSELNSIVGRCLSLYFELEDDIIRFFIRYCNDIVLSNKARWAILLRSDPKILKRAVKDMMNVLGYEKKLDYETMHANQIRAIIDYFATHADHKQVNNILDKYDYIELFAQGLLNCMFTTSIHDSASTISDILDSTIAIRYVIHSLSPRIVTCECTNTQHEHIETINDIDEEYERARKRNLARKYEEGVSVEDINEFIAKNPVSGKIQLESIKDIYSLQFYSAKNQDSAKKDLDEIHVAFRGNAYKLATIGCGGFMERMLKEFLYRNTEKLERLKENREFWNKLFINSPEYIDENNVKTWSLHHLIECSGQIFSDQEGKLVERCHMLRRMRNRIHGGSVAKEHSLMAFETLRMLYDEIGSSVA